MVQLCSDKSDENIEDQRKRILLTKRSNSPKSDSVNRLHIPSGHVVQRDGTQNVSRDKRSGDFNYPYRINQQRDDVNDEYPEGYSSRGVWEKPQGFNHRPTEHDSQWEWERHQQSTLKYER